MSWTTATTYGPDYSYNVLAYEIYAYTDGGDYDDHQRDALAEALMAALEDEVDARLPEGATWHPATGEFVHPIDTEMPDADEMREIFSAAWAAVEARYSEIERQVLGTLPVTADELERELRAIGDPIQRARVAGMLVDAATRQRVGKIRAEAIYQATRTRSWEQVAELLGTGVAAINKAIWQHRKAI